MTDSALNDGTNTFGGATHARRVAAVQDEIRRGGLAALLVVGLGDHGARGHIFYISGHSLWDRHGYCVVAPDGEPTLVLHTVSQRFWALRRGALSDVRVAAEPMIEVAGLLARLLDGGEGVVGVVGLDDAMSAADYRQLVQALPGASFVDASPILARLQATKDSVEQASLQVAARAADAGLRAFARELRPGRSEWELNGLVQRELFAGGAFDTLPLTLHRRGEPYLCVPQGREYRAGELASFSIEIPSPDGHWVELARMFSLGEPEAQARESVELLHDVHRALAGGLRPGARVGDVARAAEEMVRGSGHRVGIWLGHGIGLNLLEWPTLATSEDAVVQEGMAFAVHPHLIAPDDAYGVYVADTFIVGASSARALSQIPLELAVMDA